MKRLFSLVLLAGALCACSGGGGNSVAQAPAPAVTVLSSNISRMQVSGSSVATDVVIKPNFTFAGTLYATAVDSTGVIMPSVSVTANGDGSYTMQLASSTAASAGHYTGTATLKLFSDSACTVPQLVPSVAVSFDFTVMSTTSAWPGNNLSALVAWPGVPDWSTFQGNAAHTGYVPVDLDPNRFSTRWTLPAATGSDSGTSYGLPAPPTTANGRFFVAGNNLLSARKEFDGSLAWQWDFSGLQFPSVNPPAVAGGVVYMAAGQQSSTFMFALNAADGALRFQSPMSSQW